MPPEIKKRMRPMSVSFGMLDKYDEKTVLRPEERSPESPMINTFFSDKLVYLLLSNHYTDFMFIAETDVKSLLQNNKKQYNIIIYYTDIYFIIS